MSQTQKKREIDFAPTNKQFLALELLNDNVTTEILYGGSISSGKSRVACYWLILSCLKYPGTKYLLGRSRLQNLKRTTLATFMDISREWNIQDKFNYNRQENVITFKNGSQIILMDLFQYPSDPDFVKLGSLELTGAVIDEAAEVAEKAYSTIKTRLRYKLNEYGLIPKVLICSNPSKNWLYSTFYKPFVDGTLPPNKQFIQALPGDNHYNPKSYLETLTPQTLGIGVYNVLVLGRWDFASTDYDLFDHDALMNCFYSDANKMSNTRYITIDPASSGKDSTCITVWMGYNCIKILKLDKNDTSQINTKVRELMMGYNVSINNVIIDKVGVGTGVYDLLKGCVGFVANAKVFNNEPFQHLKAQLFFKFSQMVNTGMIGIKDQTYLDDVVQQLEAHKRFNIDKDGKAEVTPKTIVKQQLGCSPDIADALMMRAYFEYSGSGELYFY
jgi:phage terminase large subunit